MGVECSCKEWCGDVPEDEDDPMADCKGLPTKPSPPLVEVVVVDTTPNPRPKGEKE